MGVLTEDAQIAVARLEERFASLSRDVADFRAETKISHSEMKSELAALNTRERERNGHISDLMRDKTANDERWKEHLAVSAEYRDAVTELKGQHTAAEERKSVWKMQAQLAQQAAKGVIELAKLGGFVYVLKLIGVLG